ncbi:uncharacterized protein LOC18040817 [Citrus clementina]|nr:uncharacterized protein LOC18040817 [Citrus x clementina]
MANQIFELNEQKLQALGLEGTKTHFGHTHKLSLCSFNDGYRVSCNYCNQIIRDPVPAYCCISCEFFVHICCEEIPEKVDQIEHPFHRSIVVYNIKQRDSDEIVTTGYRYSSQRALKHKGHKHGLFYFSDKSLSSFMQCEFCCKQFEGSNFYRCVDCDVNFHVECIPLPRVVKNDKAHQHPLLLLSSLQLVYDSEKYCCDICRERGIARHHVYYCDDCKFIAHVECVLNEGTLEIEKYDLEYKSDGEEEINRFMENQLSKEHSEVEHKFHPQHRLLAAKCVSKQESVTCNACTKEITGIKYNCSSCSFSLHVSCAHKPLKRVLKRECHTHNLFYFVEDEHNFSCQKCSEKCKGGFYRCPECCINFHIDCIPLPRVVVLMKQTIHRITLILLDLVVEYDSDDQHCEICKEPRNSEDHVYYCQERNFFSHVECLLATDNIITSSSNELLCLDPEYKKNNTVQEADTKEVKKNNDADCSRIKPIMDNTSFGKPPHLDSHHGDEIQQQLNAADIADKRKKQEGKMEDGRNRQVDYFMIKVPILVFDVLQECVLVGLIFLFVLILVYLLRLWS